MLAYDEAADIIDYYPILAVWIHDDPIITYLTIDGETIKTTPNHPFYTAEGEWVHAGDLQVGETIRDGSWNTGTVEAVWFSATPKVMYNFSVAVAHTYFVGEGQWLVHNDNCAARTYARYFLQNRLDVEDRKNLMFDLGTDLENLPPNPKGHGREIIGYFERRGQLADLQMGVYDFLVRNNYSEDVVQEWLAIVADWIK